MSEIRTALSNAMKDAMRAHEELKLQTVRMIMAKIKEQDIEARAKGNMDGIAEGDVLSLMQGMIKQRQESAKMYREGNRLELAVKEDEEIKIIEAFLPAQMSDEEVAGVVATLISSVGAAGIKDMGKVMAELRAKYAGPTRHGQGRSRGQTKAGRVILIP
jgi:uncharacterized protein YqeY